MRHRLDPDSGADYRCVPDGLRCGDGTAEPDGVCLPSDPLACGAGTAREGSTCVPETTLSCGRSTVQVGLQCVPDLASLCGENTAVVDEHCVGCGALARARLPVGNGRFDSTECAIHSPLGFPGSPSHRPQTGSPR